MANVNLNENECQSQKKQILDYLKNGKSLTQMEALYKFGCFRLAARICELRDDGWGIKSESIKLNNGKYQAIVYRLKTLNKSRLTSFRRVGW